MVLLQWDDYILCVASYSPISKRKSLFLIKKDFRDIKFRIPLPIRRGSW